MIVEINEQLKNKKVFLPYERLQWIHLEEGHTLAITCKNGIMTVCHDYGMLLNGVYLLVVDEQQHWILGYGQFEGVKTRLEAPKDKKEYLLQLVDASHPIRSRRKGPPIELCDLEQLYA